VKLLDQMQRNPAGNWTIGEVEIVCAQAGVRCIHPSGGGSHYKVSHPSQRAILTIPARRPIKPFYIRELVKLIRAIQQAGTAP